MWFRDSAPSKRRRYAVYLLFWYKSTNTDVLLSEAQDQLLQEMIGSRYSQFTCFTGAKVQELTRHDCCAASDALDGPEEVTYKAFEGYWERRSWLINDDAYFALVLHNHFPLD